MDAAQHLAAPPPSEAQVWDWLSALTDPEARIRRQAAYALERLGRPTDASVLDDELKALRNALGDEDPDVRRNASEAILTVAMPKRPL